MLKIKQLLAWIKAHRTGRFALELFWPAIFALALPLQDYYRQAVTLAYPHEVILVSLAFLAVAVIVFTLYYFALRSPFSRLLAAMLAMFLLMQNSDLRAQISRLSDHFSKNTILIFPAAVLIIVGLFAWAFAGLVNRFRPQLLANITSVLRVICFVSLIFNSASAAAYLAAHFRSTQLKPSTKLEGLSLPQAPDRDIYYLVFDRYGSNESLKDYYNFDNSQFLAFLGGQGFTVRDGAYSNYQYTAPSIASTMNLDYLTDITASLKNDKLPSYLPYRWLIENSPISNLLQANGYEAVTLGSWWELTRQQNQSKNILPQFQITLFGHTHILSELQSDILGRTFLGPLLQNGLKIGSLLVLQVSTSDWANLFRNQIEELQDVASQPHTKPQFVFAHIINPHPPYIFSPDGSAPNYDSSDTNIGVPRAQKYINQLQYDNSQIEQVVQTIKTTAKKPPIIIIQADEGPYPLGFDGSDNQAGKFQWQSVATDTLKEKFGILAAYYLPDLPQDTKEQLNSSVNAFRFVLDNYFGANLSYLPDCSLAFNLGDRPFKFYDITQKLHAASTDCGQYNTVGK